MEGYCTHNPEDWNNNESAGDILGPPRSTDKTTQIIKVSKGAKIRNRYNQVPLSKSIIRSCDNSDKLIIFYDSFLVLKDMYHTRSKNPQVLKTSQTFRKYRKYWIPTHIGTHGNEQAKAGAFSDSVFSNFNPYINKYILNEWQPAWNGRI